jgi:hypothetical protein
MGAASGERATTANGGGTSKRTVRSSKASYANLATGGGYTCQVGENPPTPVKVGDYVQWTSNGVDQFKPARKVTKVENDHVWVFGSNTAIPMEQVTVSESASP